MNEQEERRKRLNELGQPDTFDKVIVLIIVGLVIFCIGYQIAQENKKRERESTQSYYERQMDEELRYEIMKDIYE